MAEPGTRLIQHLHAISRKTAAASRELQVNRDLFASIRDDDVPIMVAKIDDTTRHLTDIRVVLKSMEAKAHYGDSNAQEALKLIEDISGDVEMTGTEVDKFADFNKLLEERPMVATTLLAFLVQNSNLLYRAISTLPEVDREIIARVLKETLKDA